MTKLNIDYLSFTDYMNKALNSATRAKLRKKFRAAAQATPIEMSVVDDITPLVDEISLRALETAFRETVQRVFLQAWACNARQSSFLHLAAEREGCRLCPKHD